MGGFFLPNHHSFCQNLPQSDQKKQSRPDPKVL
jgi:hypothetical protein